MLCKVKDLVPGQVFRFKNKPIEYYVLSQNDGDVNCLPIEDLNKYPIGKRGRNYFTLRPFLTVEIPPYDEIQLKLF